MTKLRRVKHIPGFSLRKIILTNHQHSMLHSGAQFSTTRSTLSSTVFSAPKSPTSKRVSLGYLSTPLLTSLRFHPTSFFSPMPQ
ncbi:plasma membrane fusion protein PRM1 [Cryptococcus gattii E566]|uniref:Plasma membrane fusion protein PRM1 n=1 Tax=Cryptococcus gattii EJB2 TaxID=1296103 RepID=A0ABR5C3X5_9TREE|nr:plasma membrane fusion protein PRM1 [Cryptococcus gattii EJB2]KIY33873.1 plasma membrane fusion protein PRM1 [Cryptococcus gattii E566]